MKLIIDIPKEFETDYNGDKFKDFFSRVLCDIDKGTLCGSYEKETAEMFLKAFDESVPMDNLLEDLKKCKSIAPAIAIVKEYRNKRSVKNERFN